MPISEQKPYEKINELFEKLREIYKNNYAYIGEYDAAVNIFKEKSPIQAQFEDQYPTWIANQQKKFENILEIAADRQWNDFERYQIILLIPTTVVLVTVLVISSIFSAPLGIFALTGIFAGLYALLSSSNVINLIFCTLQMDKFKVQQNTFFQQLNPSTCQNLVIEEARV